MVAIRHGSGAFDPNEQSQGEKARFGGTGGYSMKRETFMPSRERTPVLTDSATKVCRTILNVDQIIEPALRAANLSRSDFDMLLDIHIADLEGRRICMWDVCQAASVPFSTAHRRLSSMIERDLVERLAPRGDWRRVIVGLSAEARSVIDSITTALGRRYEIPKSEDALSVDALAATSPRAMEI